MNVWAFYLITSLIAVFINSLYVLSICKQYQIKFYFGV